MNEEKICVKGIDEIPVFSWNTKTKEFFVLNNKFDGVNSVQDFIEFLNNLQKENQQLKGSLQMHEILLRANVEENQRLKEQYCERTDCSGRIGNSKKVEELEKENQKYKEVIEKAIELIEDNYYSKNTTDIDSIVVSNNKLLQVRNILKEVE